MEIWKEFEANELTHSAAHHLLAILACGAEYGGWARVSDIARQLGITRGSVSINLRPLKKRGLVVTDAHRMVKLSPEGLSIAQRVLAKKATVRAFLAEVLGVPPEQAEIDSCKVEHLISHPTSERLLQFVQFVLSDDALAQDLLARFHRFRGPCPPCPDGKSCEVCKDGPCLVDEFQSSV